MGAGFEQLVGRVLGGRYRLERPLGAGGMGAVFEATQIDLGRSVAVKVLLDVDPRGIARLRQEALTAGSLSCPHVVSIFDFQTPPGEPPFIVMEILPGHSLSKLLKQQPVLPVARATRIACQMLIGLEAAHRAGVVHRDVKPSNTWLVFGPGIEEHVKMLDFGIAKVLGDGQSFQTTTGSVVGTPAYLAPEQLRGAPLDARVDIHAMGVVLFQMLTGAVPWRVTGASVYAEILEREPPPVHTMAPGVPPALSSVVARALAKDPDRRFARAADLRAALEPFAATSVSPPTYLGALGAPSVAASAFAPPVGAPSAFAPSVGALVAPTANMLPMTTGTGQVAPTFASAPYALPSSVATGSYGHSTTAPVAAPSSSVLLSVVVGCGFLLLAGVGVGATIMLGHRDDGGATTAAVDGGRTVVATAGDAASTATVAAPSGLIDAGTRVAVAASPGVRPTRSGPAPNVTPATSATPSATPTPSTTPARCWCSANFGGVALCTAPMVPRCSCNASDGFTICAKWVNNSCPDTETFGGPGRKTGQPCAGFNLVDHKPVPASGTTGCFLCYGPTQRVAGTEGAACKGADAEGKIENGRFRCDP